MSKQRSRVSLVSPQTAVVSASQALRDQVDLSGLAEDAQTGPRGH